MKKKIYLLFLGFCCAGVLAAQNPLPENAAIWKEQMKTIAGFLTNHYTLCGDTLIENQVYSKIERWEVDDDLNVLSKEFFTAIRTEGEKVYFLSMDNSGEYLLYDFGLEAGDEIDLPDFYSPSFTINRTVDSVKTEMIAGQQRKVIYFQPGYPSAPVEFWMEGIGSSYSLLFRGIDPGGDIGFNLLCFQHEDEYLNLTLIECFLPQVRDCEVINSVEETNLKGQVSVYPNPLYGQQLNVSLEHDLSGIFHVELIYLDGRIAKKYSDLKAMELKLDVGNLNSGLYYLKIIDYKNGEVLGVEKLIISK